MGECMEKDDRINIANAVVTHTPVGQEASWTNITMWYDLYSSSYLIDNNIIETAIIVANTKPLYTRWAIGNSQLIWVNQSDRKVSGIKQGNSASSTFSRKWGRLSR